MQTGAGYALWLGENDVAATARGSAPERCGPGEASRYGELTRLAVQSGAGHAIWLGENDAAAITRVSPAGRCGAGEAPRAAALAAYARSLDTLAGRIAEYRP